MDMYDIADGINKFCKDLGKSIDKQKKRVAAFEERHPKLRKFKAVVNEHSEEIIYAIWGATILGIVATDVAWHAHDHIEAKKTEITTSASETPKIELDPDYEFVK